MSIKDNGGRRLGIERRQTRITIEFEDRRSGEERRNGQDRRSGNDRRDPTGFRHLAGLDRRYAFRREALINFM